jgi:hypothetical protein
METITIRLYQVGEKSSQILENTELLLAASNKEINSIMTKNFKNFRT